VTTLTPQLTYTRTTAEQFGYVVGVTCIVLGGLVAAIADPLSLEKGSWLAAYLVLVAGVLQAILAEQRLLIGGATAAGRTTPLMLILWPIGNLFVIVASLLMLPWLVGAGGVLLIASLLLALWSTRGATRTFRTWLARIIYVAVLVSVPVGLVISQVRAS